VLFYITDKSNSAALFSSKKPLLQDTRQAKEEVTSFNGLGFQYFSPYIGIVLHSLELLGRFSILFYLELCYSVYFARDFVEPFLSNISKK
jgi:hypothetical protein